MLNQDGTLKLDIAGNPIPTYDQATVTSFTNVFTGWNLCEAGGGLCPNRVLGAPNFIDSMIVSNPNNHNIAAKTLLELIRVPGRR